MMTNGVETDFQVFSFYLQLKSSKNKSFILLFQAAITFVIIYFSSYCSYSLMKLVQRQQLREVGLIASSTILLYLTILLTEVSISLVFELRISKTKVSYQVGFLSNVAKSLMILEELRLEWNKGMQTYRMKLLIKLFMLLIVPKLPAISGT